MTADEVRQVQLETLRAFSTWCEERGLHYQVAFGSLLGAVRHGGFIPWDDDIDLAMPREDYERFCAEFAADPPGVLEAASPVTSPSWPLPFAKVWDRRTVVVEHSHLPIHAGVGLDVFPIDDVPDSRFSRALHLRLNAAARALESLASVKPRAGRSRSRALTVGVLGPVARRLGCGRVARLRDHLASRWSGRCTLASIPVGPYEWTVPRAAIASTGTCPFEDLSVAAPHDPHAVLTAIYGDYTTPPPEGKRVTHHAAQRFWRAVS